MSYRQQLENGLVFRTIESEADIERYVAFNRDYNNPLEGLNTNCLIRHFPGASHEDYQLIEDPQTGEIVSTTCLIPWKIRFCGIPLRAGQLEQVLSHPGYRRHGLVRTQMKRFMEVVRERELDLSFIWGIPYYYRQYGYTYCLEGSLSEVIHSSRLPAAHNPDAYTLRRATAEDAHLLTRMYGSEMERQQIYLARKDAHWHYLLEQAKFEVYIVESEHTGTAAGYLGIWQPEDRSRLSIVEHGLANQDAGMAVLRALKTMTPGEISINGPRKSILATLARIYGSREVPGGQWLIHITNPAAFLAKIGPALEVNLAYSDCAWLTRDITINLFRQAYRLCFIEGKLEKVDPLGFVDSSMGADGGDLCIPPEAFVRLVFGFRNLDQLADAWPDIVVKTESRHLIDVLFPKMDGYLYSTYKYFG